MPKLATGQKPRAVEGAVAALDRCDAAATTLSRDTVTLKQVIDALTERNGELEVALEASEAQAKLDMERRQNAHDKEVSELRLRLATAEEKLRKVAGYLS